MVQPRADGVGSSSSQLHSDRAQWREDDGSLQLGAHTSPRPPTPNPHPPTPNPPPVPPSYFTLDDGRYSLGGGWGFLTEGGPGESPMSVDALRRTVDGDQLWPPLPDDCWGHCGSTLGLFGSLKRFNGPLAARCTQRNSETDFQFEFCSQVRRAVVTRGLRAQGCGCGARGAQGVLRRLQQEQVLEILVGCVGALELSD